MKRALLIISAFLVFVVAALAALAAFTPTGTLIWAATRTALLAPPAPPLLERVTGASGWFGACPARNAMEAAARSSGEALSPELNRRLTVQFPAGSSADALVRTLVAQRFELAEPCENDATIHRAFFKGPTRGAIFETRADIYWKADGDKLVWTKGFVMFVGL